MTHTRAQKWDYKSCLQASDAYYKRSTRLVVVLEILPFNSLIDITPFTVMWKISQFLAVFKQASDMYHKQSTRLVLAIQPFSFLADITS